MLLRQGSFAVVCMRVCVTFSFEFFLCRAAAATHQAAERKRKCCFCFSQFYCEYFIEITCAPSAFDYFHTSDIFYSKFFSENTQKFPIFIIFKQRVHKNSNFTLVYFKMAENVIEINEQHGNFSGLVQLMTPIATNSPLSTSYSSACFRFFLSTKTHLCC